MTSDSNNGHDVASIGDEVEITVLDVTPLSCGISQHMIIIPADRQLKAS